MEAADEAFVRAFARWSRVSRMKSPDGWVYRVAINHLRRRGRGREDSVAPDQLPSSIAPDSGTVTRLDVMRAVQTLPSRQRQVFALRCVADLSESAVADALGIAPGTVSRLLHDARARLRVQLDDGSDLRADHGTPLGRAMPPTTESRSTSHEA
jgi:RNA polymerase sigma-70 factor (ECF subfamily)